MVYQVAQKYVQWKSDPLQILRIYVRDKLFEEFSWVFCIILETMAMLFVYQKNSHATVDMFILQFDQRIYISIINIQRSLFFLHLSMHVHGSRNRKTLDSDAVGLVPTKLKRPTSAR